MIHYWALTVASMKMYFRNRQALFWALFFPFLIMIIFGMLNFDAFDAPDVGIADNANNDASRRLLQLLEGSPDDPLVKVSTGSVEGVLDELNEGDLDAVFVIPAGFGDAGLRSDIAVTTDLRQPQRGGIAMVMLSETLETLFLEVENIPAEFIVDNRFRISQSTIQGEGQGFKGFLVPGIAAMAIMQGGIFGVVFSLVRFRVQGVLRRLFATPMSPSHFLVGQVLTRLIVAVAQAYILLIVGALVLDVQVGGSAGAWVSLTLLSVLGGALFISMGLAISGMAKNEDVAAPVSNIIALPMMFLSGIFFPVDSLPEQVGAITQYLPLTYLADGMRSAALDGAAITALGPELIGLGIWTAVIFLIATRTFKWE